MLACDRILFVAAGLDSTILVHWLFSGIRLIGSIVVCTYIYIYIYYEPKEIYDGIKFVELDGMIGLISSLYWGVYF